MPRADPLSRRQVNRDAPLYQSGLGPFAVHTALDCTIKGSYKMTRKHFRLFLIVALFPGPVAALAWLLHLPLAPRTLFFALLCVGWAAVLTALLDYDSPHEYDRWPRQ